MHHANKCLIVNDCWHFNNYEHDNFMPSGVEHEHVYKIGT